MKNINPASITERSRVTASGTLSLQISKRFNTSPLSFELGVAADIPPGITVIFGPSGAGKTTLLECVAGLLTPNSGRIGIGGQILFDGSNKVNVDVRKRRIGYVFQDLALFPHLSAEKNIGYGIRAFDSAECEQKIASIMESFRISSLRGRKPAEISGGERQRVALARALVTDPQVLLLDEPLAALDERTKSKIIEDLRSWNDACSIPVLYVTHSRDELFALGNQVIMLEAGKIVADGLPEDLVHR